MHKPGREWGGDSCTPPVDSHFTTPPWASLCSPTWLSYSLPISSHSLGLFSISVLHILLFCMGLPSLHPPLLLHPPLPLSFSIPQMSLCSQSPIKRQTLMTPKSGSPAPNTLLQPTTTKPCLLQGIPTWTILQLRCLTHWSNQYGLNTVYVPVAGWVRPWKTEWNIQSLPSSGSLFSSWILTRKQGMIIAQSHEAEVVMMTLCYDKRSMCNPVWRRCVLSSNTRGLSLLRSSLISFIYVV